ncbi:MAG: hypothetical protein D6E12_13625 [Desulfovibrio sp.]|nr:MAG: hypothetical protein D6E12_13625 [Desulfovibrio sp.]
MLLLLPLGCVVGAHAGHGFVNVQSKAGQVIRLWFHENDAYKVAWMLDRLDKPDLIAVWQAIEQDEFVRQARVGMHGNWYSRLYIGLKREFMERIQYNR